MSALSHWRLNAALSSVSKRLSPALPLWKTRLFPTSLATLSSPLSPIASSSLLSPLLHKFSGLSTLPLVNQTTRIVPKTETQRKKSHGKTVAKGTTLSLTCRPPTLSSAGLFPRAHLSNATLALASPQQRRHSSTSSSSRSSSTPFTASPRLILLLSGGVTAYFLSARLMSTSASSDSGAPSPNSLIQVPSPSPSPSPSSTLAHIRAFLSKAESVVATPRSKGSEHVREYHYSSYAANSPCEDTLQIAHDGELSFGGGTLFGVFDGHGGGAASAFCRDELFGFISYHFNKLHERVNGNSTLSALTPEPFLDADECFLTQAITERRFLEARAGACVLVSHVNGSTVTVANAGDCRAVLGRRAEKGWSFGSLLSGPEKKWTAIELSQDHQIDTNPGEKARLIREHPNEPDIVKRDRVKGRLQPTRGLGDGMYKRMEVFANSPDWVAKYRDSGWNAPYTTVRPDIVKHDIKQGDSFLVMATDGLYQDLSSQEVVEYVGEYMDKYMKPGQVAPVSAGTYLIEKALLRASEKYSERYYRHFGKTQGKDTTFLHPSKASSPTEPASEAHTAAHLGFMLSLPPHQRRKLHDDISVIVVFFQEQPSTTQMQPLPTQPNTSVSAQAASTTVAHTASQGPALRKWLTYQKTHGEASQPQLNAKL